MPEFKNRLEQVELLYKFLKQQFNIKMREKTLILTDSSINRQALIITACNFIDLQRYINFDHLNLGNEPIKLFMHEIRKCQASCRLDKTQTCYCDGNCFTDKYCSWLRYSKGRPYCYLAAPWIPQFETINPTPELYREKALKACKTKIQENFVDKCLPKNNN